MHAVARDGGDHGRPDATRDDEFSSYMHARQPSLLRTAYLLTGDRHTAEDLVQTALRQALPVVGQGPATAARSTATSAGSWSTRTTRCGAARWKRREFATDDAARPAATTTTYDERRRPRALGPRADAAEEGPRGRRAALLRGALRGRDRRGARHLRRHREVPGQPRAGHPARTRTPDPEPPSTPGGGAMNDHLTTRLTRQLHEQVDRIGTAPARPRRRPRPGPLASGATPRGWRRRPRPPSWPSPRRSRSTVAGGSTAARSDRPRPPDTDGAEPDAARPTGRFPLTPRRARRARCPAPATSCSTATSSSPPDGPDRPARATIVQLAPYDGGWVGIRAGDFADDRHQRRRARRRLRARSSAVLAGPSLAVSADGSRVAWVEVDGDGDLDLGQRPPARHGRATAAPVEPSTAPPTWSGSSPTTRWSSTTTDAATRARVRASSTTDGRGRRRSSGLSAVGARRRGDRPGRRADGVPRRRLLLGGASTDAARQRAAVGDLRLLARAVQPGRALRHRPRGLLRRPGLADAWRSWTPRPASRWSSSQQPPAADVGVVGPAVWEDDDTVLATVDQGGEQAVVRLEAGRRASTQVARRPCRRRRCRIEYRSCRRHAVRPD